VLPTSPILILALAHGAIQFLGNAECPTSQEVLDEIGRLNPASEEEPARHLAQLQSKEGGLEVRLFDRDGTLIERHLIPGKESCTGWARTAAVVLVTWEAELQGPMPTASAVPPPPPLPPALSPPSPPPTVVLTEPATQPEPQRWVGEFGVALMYSGAKNAPAAPGAELRVALEPAERPYGVEFTLIAFAPRAIPLSLSTATANWSWYALGLGGHVALGPPKLKLEFAVDPLAGLFVTRGIGVSVPETATAFDPGIMGSARLRWAISGSALLWVQFSGVAWLRAEQAQVFSGGMPLWSGPLPRSELMGALGFSLLEFL
jgi:hypothetical protein